jgi:hypothetical protein
MTSRSLLMSLWAVALIVPLIVTGASAEETDEENQDIDPQSVAKGVNNYRKAADAIDEAEGVRPNRGIRAIRGGAKGVRRGIQAGTGDIPGLMGDTASDLLDRGTLPKLAKWCNVRIRGRVTAILWVAGRACPVLGVIGSDYIVGQPIEDWARRAKEEMPRNAWRKDGKPYVPQSPGNSGGNPNAQAGNAPQDEAPEHIPYAGPSDAPGLEDPVLSAGNYGACGPMTPDEKAAMEQAHGDNFVLAYEGIRLMRNRLKDPAVSGNYQQAAQTREIIAKQQATVAGYLASHRKANGCPHQEQAQAQECGPMSEDEQAWIRDNKDANFDNYVRGLEGSRKNLKNMLASRKPFQPDVDSTREWIGHAENRIAEMLEEARSELGSCPPVLPPGCAGGSGADDDHLAQLRQAVKRAEFFVEKGEEHHRMFPIFTYPGKDLISARERLQKAQQALTAAESVAAGSGNGCGPAGPSAAPQTPGGNPEAANDGSANGAGGQADAPELGLPAGYRRISPNACINSIGDVISC